MAIFKVFFCCFFFSFLLAIFSTIYVCFTLCGGGGRGKCQVKSQLNLCSSEAQQKSFFDPKIENFSHTINFCSEESLVESWEFFFLFPKSNKKLSSIVTAFFAACSRRFAWDARQKKRWKEWAVNFFQKLIKVIVTQVYILLKAINCAPRRQ